MVKKQAGNIFHTNQTFSGSQNIYLSGDTIPAEIATRYTGKIDDIIDLKLNSFNHALKYYKPKGVAVGLCENLRDEDWKLTDIRGRIRANPTDAGAYDTGAV